MITLYNKLMDLCKNSEVFFYNDEIGLKNTDDRPENYRVFTYRLASAKDFVHDYSLESRGIMFRMENSKPVELVCRPQLKFFNMNESTQSTIPHGTPFSDILYALVKMDGSIINSYFDIDKELQLKSHTKLDSPMAIEAIRILKNNPDFYEAVHEAQSEGYTVNFEYTSPFNQVVLLYGEEKLTVLNVRNIESGEMLVADALKNKFPKLHKYSVLLNGNICSSFPVTKTINESAQAVLAMDNVEGFIIGTSQGTFKLKTNWYCTRHRAHDSVLTVKGLFFMVIEGAVDDAKPLFRDSPLVLDKIEKMENLVKMYYNRIKKTVEDFYEENGHLSIHEYADAVRKFQMKDIPSERGALFLIYRGQEVPYIEMMKKDYRDIIY